MLARLVAISGQIDMQRSEPQQFRFIAHPTSNQLKACSCVRNWPSERSLVSPTFHAAESGK